MDVDCSTGCERVQVFGGEVLLPQAVLPEENTGMVPEKPGLALGTLAVLFYGRYQELSCS